MLPDKIDVIVTSCNRHDLLSITLVSFFNNLLPEELAVIGNVYVFEDSDKLPALPELPVNVQILYSEKRHGQIKALDTLMGRVRTPYYFSLEDDWQFIRPGFITHSYELMQPNPHLCMVNVRGYADQNGHPVIRRGSVYHYQPGYKGQWYGFGFNPSLRRLADYKRIGSYSKLAKFDIKAPWKSEVIIGKKYHSLGMYAVCTHDQFVRHIGENRGIRQ